MEPEGILVVDGDPALREAFCGLLSQAGYRVDTAADEAGAVAAVDGCDLVVLNYTLPNGDAFSAFQQMRAARPDLAGLLLTGHTSLNIAVEALNRGFSQVVGKPVEPARLREAVAAALLERRAVLENSRLRALTSLYQGLQQLATIDQIPALAQTLVELAVAQTSAERASLMLLDAHRRALQVTAAVGYHAEAVKAGRRLLGEPVSGWVLKHGVALEVSSGRPLPAAVKAVLGNSEVTAAVCLPLYPAGQPLGVLNLSRISSGEAFPPGDLEIGSALATDGGLALRRLALLEERARSERAATVGGLAGSIIHDLRGPATIIGGAGELLEETNPESAPELTAIRRGVAELDRLCEQLLGFARERDATPPQAVDLAAVLTAAVAAVAPRAAEGGIDLELAELPGGLWLETVPDDLERAVAALLEAGVVASVGGGRIRLAATALAESCEVELSGIPVSDPAVALPPGLDEPDALAADGPGLALMVARHVAERRGGRLEIELGPASFLLRLLLPRQSRP